MAEAGKREAILARMRQSLGVAGDDDARRSAVRERIRAHAANLVPSRAQVGHSEQVELFRAQAEAVNATVGVVAKPGDIPEAVSLYLRDQNLPSALRHGDDELLQSLPWKKKAPNLEINTGKADPSDEVSLSHAAAGIAETGTLVLTSGADNPTTLNFLPENHIVIVEEKAITGSYEDAWQMLRDDYGERHMPRTVNLISGPSRTADIEQRIELGAHGPRRLHIIIVQG